MSSDTTPAVAISPAAVTEPITATDTVEKARRRFPPPCWTQEETLALIDAYRERWYALRRGYLRTADWDAVSASVASRCPGASPAKTSAQCRHKMEKLRQRYRAEKQRALSFPNPGGRYFSSWFFFENMEAMENGTTPAPKPDISAADGSKLKSFLDQNMLKLKIKAKDSADLDPDLRHGNAVKAKRFNSGIKSQPQYSSYLDTDVVEEDAPDDDDLINLGRITQPMNGIPKSKSRKSGKLFDNVDFSGGFHHQMLPPGLRMKKSGKLDTNTSSRSNPIEELWVEASNNNHQQHYTNNYSFSGAPDLRSKYWPGSNPGSATHGSSKRGRNAVEEIVESIKMLGEGYVKVERAKMEMAREMEAMRMEMEMKRNEMLLQSQKQIVDVFLKGLIELKQSKKLKKSDSAKPDSADEA